MLVTLCKISDNVIADVHDLSAGRLKRMRPWNRRFYSRNARRVHPRALTAQEMREHVDAMVLKRMALRGLAFQS